MARLFGAQRMVLQALLDAQGETSAFIEDSRIAQATNISPKVVWLLVSIDRSRRRPPSNHSGLEARQGERGLVIGISDYPPPIRKLPAVANDVREMAILLGSDKGQFHAQNVLRLTDAEATSQKLIEAIETTFAKVQPDDSVFACMN